MSPHLLSMIPPLKFPSPAPITWYHIWKDAFCRASIPQSRILYLLFCVLIVIFHFWYVTFISYFCHSLSYFICILCFILISHFMFHFAFYLYFIQTEVFIFIFYFHFPGQCPEKLLLTKDFIFIFARRIPRKNCFWQRNWSPNKNGRQTKMVAKQKWSPNKWPPNRMITRQK